MAAALEAAGGDTRVIIHTNTHRRGALYNTLHAVHIASSSSSSSSSSDDDDDDDDDEDEEVVVVLDGDDWLAGPHVLSQVARVYKDTDTWVTYGTYVVFFFFSECSFFSKWHLS